MRLAAELANIFLAVTFWATLGLLLLTRMTGGEDNLFVGVLRKATAPAFAVVGLVVPRSWIPVGVLILAVALRFALVPLLREP